MSRGKNNDILRQLTTNEHVTTIILLFAVALLGIKIAQFYLPKPPSPIIAFTCAVAAHSQAGELCVKGSPGASVSVTVHYCDGTQVNSPRLQVQEDGEYR